MATLTERWGLGGHIIRRNMLAEGKLLVGPPMSDTSKVMTQTKRGTLVFQVAGLGLELTPPPPKHVLLGSL
jgi:hypothetical protein